jgi:DNA-binding MarR family transcriptional regulator
MLDLRSKARQQLLAYYFTNPTARHHLRDLAERLSIDPSNLSKEFGRGKWRCCEPRRQSAE